MQKVYLLLRNNLQTGPHSLDELLQLSLKPYDLIWVEGKSYGWSYPSEIDSLKFFVAAPDQKTEALLEPAIASSLTPSIKITNNKRIFVSFPANNTRSILPAQGAPAMDAGDLVEQKAEELRKRAMAYIPKDPLQKQEIIKTSFARNLTDVDDDYTNWVYKKKTKKKAVVSKKYYGIAAIVFVGLIAGWWAGKTVFTKKLVSAPQLAVKNSLLKSSPEATITEKQLEKKSVIAKTNAFPTGSNTAVKKIKEQKTEAKKSIQQATPILMPETAKEPEQNTTVIVPEEKKEQPSVAEETKKKKSLKDIIGGIFNKKNKEETPTEKPKESDNSNNQRTSTHRSDEAHPAPPIVSLTDQVDIKMNKNDDDWMMGVQGLKLTLYNRSNSTLKNAAVELSYYSEQNSLLEKRIISFSNVSSKKKQTVAAPDHRLADHVEYILLSANGVDDAYAKQ